MSNPNPDLVGTYLEEQDNAYNEMIRAEEKALLELPIPPYDEIVELANEIDKAREKASTAISNAFYWAHQGGQQTILVQAITKSSVAVDDLATLSRELSEKVQALCK